MGSRGGVKNQATGEGRFGSEEGVQVETHVMLTGFVFENFGQQGLAIFAGDI